MEININDYVWVRLAEHGKNILQQQHQDLLNSLPEAAQKIIGAYAPPPEKDGWSRFQLWELMNCFGRHVYNGCEMPFKTIIKVEPIVPENLNKVSIDPPLTPHGFPWDSNLTGWVPPSPPAGHATLHVLVHRQFFPVLDEALHLIPTGATHYTLRRLADGPAVNFWRNEPSLASVRFDNMKNDSGDS